MKSILAAISLSLLIAAPALACDPQLDIASLEVTSRYLWRGIELGSSTYGHARADFALCGPRAAEKGPNGWEASVDAALPLSGHGTNLASAGVRYLRFFGDGNASWVSGGLTEYHWGEGRDKWSSEASIQATRKVNVESIGLTVWPYFEASYDFNRFDAAFTKAGVHHVIGSNALRIAADLDASVSASNYANDFGFHDAELTLWVDWTARPSGTIDLGAGGGRAWVADTIGSSRTWVGVRVRIR